MAEAIRRFVVPVLIGVGVFVLGIVVYRLAFPRWTLSQGDTIQTFLNGRFEPENPELTWTVEQTFPDQASCEVAKQRHLDAVSADRGTNTRLQDGGMQLVGDKLITRVWRCGKAGGAK